MSKSKFVNCLKYVFTALLIISIVSIILYEKDNFINTMAVNNNIKEEYVYPVGLPAGIYLRTNGVMVIDSVEFEDEEGNIVNPSKNKIYPGDYITKFNDTAVGNKSQLQYLIKNNGNNEIVLTIMSQTKYRTECITPQKNKRGEYNLGIWIRDDMQSIGTISFLTEDNQFFSLGHGICDIDTGQLLTSNEGFMYKANIWGIKKGKSGNPGGLCGSINYNDSNKIGNINLNTKNGIWGTIYAQDILNYKTEKMKIGHSDSVKTGKAKLKMILENTSQTYDIEIININYDSKEKNMVIKITDKKLLDKTNGIVQGMSGCPIIQNNKVVGVLTHVMVNNPDYGYGILFDKIYQ